MLIVAWSIKKMQHRVAGVDWVESSHQDRYEPELPINPALIRRPRNPVFQNKIRDWRE